MHNIGEEEFDYDSFKAAFDADPTIAALTKRFDQNGVELISKKNKSSSPVSPAKSDIVHQTAMRATNNAKR